jgi:hypothetical protein
VLSSTSRPPRATRTPSPPALSRSATRSSGSRSAALLVLATTSSSSSSSTAASAVTSSKASVAVAATSAVTVVAAVSARGVAVVVLAVLPTEAAVVLPVRRLLKRFLFREMMWRSHDTQRTARAECMILAPHRAPRSGHDQGWNKGTTTKRTIFYIESERMCLSGKWEGLQQKGI